MVSNNTDDKKQQKTEGVEHVDLDSWNDSVSLPLSLSAPVVVVVVPSVLSFGTILEEFPDFLSCVLVYIADRVIWNSIAVSTKDMHKKSKAIQPPWPLCYKLPLSGDCWSWSPCGTRIACSFQSNNIAIFDQRHGPFRNNENDNNDSGWSAHDEEGITDLKYSPDGRFLVSIGDDEFVRVWDSTRNYEQIQEWNMREEVVHGWINDLKVSVSACSKYIAVSAGTRVFLKDVETGSTIKSLLLPDMNIYNTTNRFSSDGRAVFIYVNFYNDNIAIMVWRPYLDVDNEDLLITLWRQTDLSRGIQTVTISDDHSMVAIRTILENEGTLCSIDTEHKCLTKKFDCQGHIGLSFTPDGKYIVLNKENGPILWSITEGKVTNNTLCFWDNGSNTTHNNLAVKSLSPNNRQCIVQRSGTGSRYIASSDYLYITSYFVK